MEALETKNTKKNHIVTIQFTLDRCYPCVAPISVKYAGVKENCAPPKE
jgi:hypothetical protein